jgi:hypothetical protein
MTHHGSRNDVCVPDGWNGCWEVRKARSICRWIITWKNVDRCLAGCIGGYSGGGGFQLETFVNKNKNLYLSFEENLSQRFSEKIINAVEICLDKAIEFHDHEAWQESDNLVLTSGKAQELRQSNDLIFGGNPIPTDLAQAFECIGLISRPRSIIFSTKRRT